MPTYSKADHDTDEMIDGLITGYYPDLTETKAAIGAVFAYPTLNSDGEPTGPAVQMYGQTAISKVKVNGEADRIEGKPDATITLSYPEWTPLSADERRAVLDRMLYTIKVKKTDGDYSRDDQGRPKLKLQKPDWFYAGFQKIAERHGAASQELIQGRQLATDHGQLLFGFAAEQAHIPGFEPGPEPEPEAKARRPRRAASTAGAKR